MGSWKEQPLLHSSRKNASSTQSISRYWVFLRILLSDWKWQSRFFLFLRFFFKARSDRYFRWWIWCWIKHKGRWSMVPSKNSCLWFPWDYIKWPPLSIFWTWNESFSFWRKRKIRDSGLQGSFFWWIVPHISDAIWIAPNGVWFSPSPQASVRSLQYFINSSRFQEWNQQRYHKRRSTRFVPPPHSDACSSGTNGLARPPLSLILP